MDRGQFDALARLVWTKRSRRAAIAALLEATLLGHDSAAVAAKVLGKRNGNRKGADKGKGKKKAQGNRPCYPGTSCIAGQGKNNAGCDFSRTSRFRDREAQGSQLSGANFTSADLSGANFQGVDLGGACLTDAVLFGAVIDASTNLKDAIFCNTVMPDGSVNNSGCDRGTRCCPTTCEGEDCADQTCIKTIGQFCSIFGNPCCAPGRCTPLFTPPELTFCQWPCVTDSDCTKLFGIEAKCVVDLETCFIGTNSCCRYPN